MVDTIKIRDFWFCIFYYQSCRKEGEILNKIVFGTGGLLDTEGESIIKEALDVGFKMLDTATAYGNEEIVGNALKGIRNSVEIITKIKGEDHGYINTITAVDRSLKKLDTDFIDYFLIHWPLPHKGLYLDSFNALLDKQKEGVIKHVGVSNFNISHLKEIYSNFGVFPSINQVELHPYFQQKELREFHRIHNIETFAWSPLNKKQRNILEEPIICNIAKNNFLSPTQIILAFEQNIGVVPVVKSKNKDHMNENISSLQIELTKQEIELLKSLDRGWRRGGDPKFHDE